MDVYGAMAAIPYFRQTRSIHCQLQIKQEESAHAGAKERNTGTYPKKGAQSRDGV
jgi:hypothetical protein